MLLFKKLSNNSMPKSTNMFGILLFSSCVGMELLFDQGWILGKKFSIGIGIFNVNVQLAQKKLISEVCYDRGPHNTLYTCLLSHMRR